VRTLPPVYLKTIVKTNKKYKTRVVHYRMVESYRQLDKVKHQTMLYLGALEELPLVEDKIKLGRRIDEIVIDRVMGTQNIFSCENQVIEQMAQKFALEIIEKNNIDVSGKKKYTLIETEGIKNKDVKGIGGEWLCYQTLDKLKLRELLTGKGWLEEDIQLAITHIISRCVNPASEHATSKWIKQNSGVCEITAYPVDKITKDKLYKISLKLHEIKDELETHLSHRTNELFDIDDKVIIYDLTNMYFEGKMDASQLALRGHSKEKRSDAKLIVLAAVVNEAGFIKYSNIFEGNMNDGKSLIRIIDRLKEKTQSNTQPIIVMDAGISTEENLKMLRAKKFDYLCVSRSGMRNYQVDASGQTIEIKDRMGQSIYLQTATVPNKVDRFLHVHSLAKQAKEESMHAQFKKRFEIGLENIKASLAKKSGVKKVGKVNERIGRLKQKYTSIHKHYTITLTPDQSKDQIIDLKWEIASKPTHLGQYLLRTTLNEKDEKTQWFIYNTIREVESTFRTLKTDLDIRPIYHKTDAASMAHLHLGLLAYTVVNTIRYQLKQNNYNHDWTEIRRIMSTQSLVTTVMQNHADVHISVRKCSEPNELVQFIYDSLHILHKPFNLKKSVVPHAVTLKKQLSSIQPFPSG
jgi:hypothetical protein